MPKLASSLGDKFILHNQFVKESQRAGRPKDISNCISIDRVNEERIFHAIFCEVIVRRTISFYNKEAIFFAGEGVVKFQMHDVDWLNVELFLFQLILRTVRSF